MQKIIPHLWYDKEAREAADFYMSLFKNSRIKNTTILNDTPSGTAELLTIELEGQEFMLISAGPFFKFTPAVSFLVACNSTNEAELLWDKFVENGSVLIPLETYNFSRKFGWVMDKYGLFWQIIHKDEMVIEQKITPVVTFVGEQSGKAEEAIQFYTSIFKHSKINNILRYNESDTVNRANTVENGEFILENQTFIAMDSPHDYDFTFNEAISFVVNCDTQEEIDYYWDKLSAYPEAEQCGWLKDRYGLSWQITPTIMNDMMNEKDDLRLANVTKAFLKMKKFDISELKKAYAKITIQTTINAPIEKVWEYWTKPEHIKKWNSASGDFDFSGTYDEMKLHEVISYVLVDGRKVKSTFISEDEKTKIIETFDPEEANSIQVQQEGWQAILDNFKKYTEQN